jgi:hypothetical protein
LKEIKKALALLAGDKSDRRFGGGASGAAAHAGEFGLWIETALRSNLCGPEKPIAVIREIAV